MDIRDIIIQNEFNNELDVRLDNCKIEQPADSNTVRPNFQPEPSQGRHFEPLRIQYRDPVINALPTTPLSLFQLFLPLSIAADWAAFTNEGQIPGPEGPPTRRSRKLQWIATTATEVYLWLGVVIYMGIHKEIKVSDHWKTSRPGCQIPTHPITKFMTRDRFQMLFRRVRPFNAAKGSHTTTYDRINAWSAHLQAISLEVYCPGTNIAVDECISGFQGRAREVVTIPTKPTPTGYNNWVVAQRGFFLGWIWHTPRAISVTKQRRKTTDNVDSLNPTQSVVIALINLLPKASYHIFLDNLFSSPSLFRVLRQRGIGATGTCRTNCGLYQAFVIAKAEDTKGRCWPHNKLEAIPTPDEMVCI